MADLNLALIGNCVFGALIDARGRICWACLPRFDGDPVFCSLLNGAEERPRHGFFDIEIDDFDHAEQAYVGNTAVLTTTLFDRAGSAVEITDFAPRFKQYGRVFRPMTIVRRLTPVAGNPRITVRVRPAGGYGAEDPEITRGSNHIRYVLPEQTLRLTTDAPVSMVLDELPFMLDEPMSFILGADESLNAGIEQTSRQFQESTLDYWNEWCRYLSIPFEWQDAVLRAAITLKLCSFEETGGVVAAVTTSIPEAPGSGRNWDYRYCWLRDAYFVVNALNRLGATRTMEYFLSYISDVVAGSRDGRLQPVYGVTTRARLEEHEVPSLAGYRGMGPVRVGNQAYEHVQNDVYGSVILASTHSFFDQRLVRKGTPQLFERLERIGEQAAQVFDQPDAGLWELRTRARVHTYSAVMCWAGCDRLAKIAARLGLGARARHWRGVADRMHREIMEKAWNPERNCFTESFGGTDMDASLLCLADLGFVSADDPRFIATVACAERTLRQGDYIHRYHAADDFGEPESAFIVCTFWYIEALAAIGRREEARELFEKMLARRNPLGLLSEDVMPETGELWGNFPQTYSMVGLIKAAMRLSRGWDEAV